MMETTYGNCYQEINVQTSIFICSLPEHGLPEPEDSRHVAVARVIKFKDYITKVILCVTDIQQTENIRKHTVANN